jgi:hypothetical protein
VFEGGRGVPEILYSKWIEEAKIKGSKGREEKVQRAVDSGDMWQVCSMYYIEIGCEDRVYVMVY